MPPEATEYIDLDITDEAGQMPLVKYVTGIYSYESADAVTTSPPTTLTMALRSQSEPFPEGYAVGTFIRIEKTTTRYDNRGSTYGLNFNASSKTRLNQIFSGSIYGLGSLPAEAKATATGSGSAGTRRYVERTITFVLVPEGCIEEEEETEE